MLRISRKCLSDSVIELKGDENIFLRNLKEQYKLSDDDFKIVKQTIQKTYLPQFKSKWNQANRTKDRFYKKFDTWLNGFVIFKKIKNVVTAAGRPTKKIEESSERSQRRKVADLEKSNKLTIAELQSLLERRLCKEGKRDEAAMIGEVLSLGAHEFRQRLQCQNTVTKFSKDESLALMTDIRLSRYQYNSLREQCLLKNADIFPSYNQIFQAKSECYPSLMEITEKGAFIKMQQLLDHTVQRLFQIKDVKQKSLETKQNKFLLHSKWGCDGASGNSIYKQNFQNSQITDESVFSVSWVPIQLISIENEVIWKNPHPSSSNYCRPLFFEFLKETPENVTKVVKDYEAQIKNLTETTVSIADNHDFSVSHNLSLTMIDGKICQILTNTSSAACCPICKAKPSEMNDLVKIRRKDLNSDAFKYGLSSLHALIRFMEFILNIAYRLDLKK